MSRTRDSGKGQYILKEIYRNEPIGIGFRELQRRTGFGNDTIASWLKFFQSLNKVKYLERKIHLTEIVRKEYERGLFEIPINDREKSKNRRPVDKEAKDNQERCRFANTIIAIVAVLGNQSYKRTDNTTQPGGLVMRDIIGNHIRFKPHEIPGTGLSDFRKKEVEGIQSTLDRRILVASSELLSYLDFTDQEIQRCI